jgi:hypothetical protein
MDQRDPDVAEPTSCDAAHWYGTKFPDLDCVHWMRYLAHAKSQASCDMAAVDTAR